MTDIKRLDITQAIIEDKVKLKRIKGRKPLPIRFSQPGPGWKEVISYELSWSELYGDVIIKLDMDGIFNWAKVRALILAYWMRVPEEMKNEEWHDLLNVLSDNANKRDKDGG